MTTDLDTDLLRAFVTVADSRSFTRAGQALYRTQSAVSMQVKRLEDVVGKRLFERDSRNIRVTPEGEYLLGYARRILRLNDEAMVRFTEPDLEGAVRIGTPDDYATYFLPRVLAPFAVSYPRVSVEVTCDNSLDLVSALGDGEMDLALVTRHPASSGGETLRREPLNWVTSASHFVHEESPLPMALFPDGCVCRSLALRALDDLDRKWRIAYSSRSISAIQGAVAGGLAISVMEQSTIPEGVRILGREDGFPALPSVEIMLHRAPGPLSAPAQRFAEHMIDELGE